MHGASYATDQFLLLVTGSERVMVMVIWLIPAAADYHEPLLSIVDSLMAVVNNFMAMLWPSRGFYGKKRIAWLRVTTDKYSSIKK